MDKDIDITTKVVGGKKIIDAPPLTVIHQNNQVKFQNKLESTVSDPGDGVNIQIKFYEATESGNYAVSAKDVCKNYKKGELLEVEANKHQNCKIDDLINYKYDIIAEEGYDPVDPVIIVEPPSFPLFGVITIVGAAVLGLGMAYYIGFRRGANQNK